MLGSPHSTRPFLFLATCPTYSPEKLGLAAENVVRGLLGRARASGRLRASAADAKADDADGPSWPPALEPRATMPSPRGPVAASATRRTPLGLPWRAFDAREFSARPGVPGAPRTLRLARPEAVLESLRRALNAEPFWAAVAGAGKRVFPEMAFEERDDEPSVGEEASWLEAALDFFPARTLPDAPRAIPWCDLRDERATTRALDAEFKAAEADGAAASTAPGAVLAAGAAPAAAAAEANARAIADLTTAVSSLRTELDAERGARASIEAQLAALRVEVDALQRTGLIQGRER
jgi:hypothetical protein